MEIINIDKKNMSDYCKDAKGSVICIHIKIKNIKKRAVDIIDSISNRSWISKLGPIEQKSYKARAKKTIEKLVKEIFEKVDDVVTEEFGEYLVSESARDSLEDNCKHKKLPLAELWKEKISGNPGFDFHTESPSCLVAFGEAKYSSKINPHTVAIKQIVEFIRVEKDVMELVDLKNFTSDKAIVNAMDNKKAYVAAFSINGIDYERIFKNALKSEHIASLLEYPELYLIGVEV